MKALRKISLLSFSFGIALSCIQQKTYKRRNLLSKEIIKKSEINQLQPQSKCASTTHLIIKVNQSNKTQLNKVAHVLDMINNMCIKKNSPISFIIEDTDNTSNDPKIFISNKQTDLNVELSIKRILEEKHYFEEAVNNITTASTVSSYSKVREAFSFIMDDIRNNIVLVHRDYPGKLDLFRSDKTKVVYIDSDDLCNKLKIEKDKIYEYKAPRLPFKLSASTLNNFLESQKEYDLDALSYYLNHNPKGFVLNFGLFRNEYTEIPSEYVFSDKKASIKSRYYKKENILELGEIEPKLGKAWKNSTGIDILVYVSNYGQLKDNMLEFLLYGKYLIYI